MELLIEVEDATLPATLTLPTHSRAGLIVLHGAHAGSRDYFLYDHLARLLAPMGVAVLRYDRRRGSNGQDVPLQQQVDDAVITLGALAGHVPGAPLGVWGYSQGAWVAELLAADRPELVSFLIAVSAAGVSPAEQMLAGTAQQLQRRNFTKREVAEALDVRRLIDVHRRTGAGQSEARARLEWATTRAWFPYASLPATLPDHGSWPDMDFDPGRALERVRCPTLALYGEADEWIPLPESVAAWSAYGSGIGRETTVIHLPGADHLPTHGGIADAAEITAEYSDAVSSWLDQHLAEFRGRKANHR